MADLVGSVFFGESENGPPTSSNFWSARWHCNAWYKRKRGHTFSNTLRPYELQKAINMMNQFLIKKRVTLWSSETRRIPMTPEKFSDNTCFSKSIWISQSRLSFLKATNYDMLCYEVPHRMPHPEIDEVMNILLKTQKLRNFS